MKESEIQEVLRDAMPDQTTAPDFHEVWAEAGMRHRRSRRRIAAIGSVAAAAAVIAIVLGIRTDAPPATDDEFLIAYALENSTSWQAPSDTLLPDYRDDIYGEIPTLMESTIINEGSLL